MGITLITGASRGIGAATALLSARSGYDVAINYMHHREKAEEIAHEIEALGRRALVVQADVSNPDDVGRLFKTLDKEMGTIQGLVNNAGTLEPQMKFEQMEADRIGRVISTNIIGTMLCARESVRRMSWANGGQGGAIVNVSSIAAKTGSPFEYVDYAASKGAIDSFTIGLAKEVAAEGIRVNAVRPGLIYTDIHAQGGEPGRVDRLKAKIPLGRGGEAEEVAEAIMWLLSDRASFTTGSFIDVAGGL